MNDNIVEVREALKFTKKIVDNLDYYINVSNEFVRDLQKEQFLDKLVAETLLFLLLVNRLPQQDEVSSLVSEMASKLDRYARSPRHLLILSSNPQAVVGVALSHIILNKLGVKNNIFDDVIDAAFSSKFVCSVDRPNFRQMEMRWLQCLFKGIQPDFSDLLPCSLLMQPLHPIYMRREDAYAVTHAVMYLTNFGEISWSNVVSLKLIESFLEHSVSWCLAYMDWDLLGEILIVYLLVGCQESSFYITASIIMRNIFKKNTVMPGPNHNNEVYAQLESHKKIAYRDIHGYHSTYVYGILRVLELVCNPNQSVTSEVCGIFSSDSYSEHGVRLNIQNILEYERDEFSSDWLTSFISNENLGICEILLNSRLIYRAREGEFGKLLIDIESYESSGMKRVMETCGVASEKVIQFLRATAYKKNTESTCLN